MSKEKYKHYSDYENYETLESEIVEGMQETVPPPPEPIAVKVMGNTRLNLREAPQTDAAILRVLLPHEELITASELNSEWLEVYTNAGECGYVCRKFVMKVNEE